MTIQMTRLPHNSVEAATGCAAPPVRQEERYLRMSPTPHWGAVTRHLDDLAARIGRLEVAHVDQHATHRSEAMCLQVMISPLAPQRTTHASLTTVGLHGPEVTTAGSHRGRVRWPRYRGT